MKTAPGAATFAPGLKHLAVALTVDRIYGATLLAAGLGPLLVGAIADQAGGYGDALIAGAVCLAIAATLLLLLPDAERHQTRQGAGCGP